MKLFKILHQAQLSLKGRHFVSPEDLTGEELQSLLWTAFDLKHRHKAKDSNIETVVHNKVVALLTGHDCFQYVTLAAAANLLKFRTEKIVLPEWEKSADLTFYSKYMQENVDMLLCHTKYTKVLTKMKDRIPIVCYKCPTFSLFTALTDMMTIYGQLGRLEGVHLFWKGSACDHLNSYISLSTRMGINVSYDCKDDSGEQQTPIGLKDHTAECKGFAKEVKEDEIAKKDVSVVRYHEHTSKPITKCSMFTESLEKNLSFEHPKNLISESWYNLKYVIAAVVVRFLVDYEHTTPRPNFAGDK